MPKLVMTDVTKPELAKPVNRKSDGTPAGTSSDAPASSKPMDAVQSAPKANNSKDIE